MKKVQVLALIAVAMFLVNCSSTPDKEEESVTSPAAAVEGDGSGMEEFEEAGEEDEVLLGEAIRTERIPVKETVKKEVKKENRLPVDEKIVHQSSPPHQPYIYSADIPLEGEQLRRTQRAVVQQSSRVEQLEYTPQQSERTYEVVQFELNQPRMESVGFRSGMKSFKKDCNMRSAGSRNARILGQIDTGKRLWVDNHSANWAKVYRKSGPAYVYKGCL